MTVDVQGILSKRLIFRGVASVITAVSLTIPPAIADTFHSHWIRGAIETTYHRLGGWNHFGDALNDESVSAWNGRYQHFANNKSIYWHPNADNGIAHAVEGRIRDKWADLGWENTILGYPITDELTPPDRIGRFNHFQSGSIYWSPATDAHNVQGQIRDAWQRQGWEAGKLGYPATDEITTPDGVGRFNRFEHGHIYWSPTTGAHIIEKDMFDLWGANGWEAGTLGYPTSDRYQLNGAVTQDFQHGRLQIFPATGQVLRTYDNKAYSSYRQIYPIVTTNDHPRLHEAGMMREVIQHMGTYFPLSGCPEVLAVGATCTFTTTGGGKGPATVDRISDTGFTLITGDGHPEGKGRILNIRFDHVTAPATADKDMVFTDPTIQKAYVGSNKTWLRMIVESFGETSTTKIAGPFSSDHVGTQVWSQMATSITQRIDRATTIYGKVTG
ncbi:LGFP repeat-containing protein [Corynebacterium epidermidicanis]|uniref:LGFP repeat protein n=1 Tax=Corynebacterium epidermidicanis TaxID=1050174 RepID=A0A0G3GS52_9CORY|nr:hypothetical protein [Corynebacterium epidermidicanis]AKK03959.1 LGFP repeat protein [Corynebacterium epidermidicanis]